MGEQPTFTTKAHVFQIDPETKKNWLSLVDHAVSVSFYYDSARHFHRIISVEGSKALINSTVNSGMNFTRTSQTFGQWKDSRANTVYGLGFETEPELTKFIEKFKEVKELSRHGSSKCDVNGSLSDDADHTEHTQLRSPSVSSLQSNSSAKERRNSYTGSPMSNTSHPSITSTEAQLRHDNDRLKLALAQSSANAKKWEVELQTLKNNNARLTTALQESTSNVEEWKKQLTAYKEESSRLKTKVLEMETTQANEETKLEKEVTTLTENLEHSDQEISERDEAISQLRKQLSELMTRDALSKSVHTKVQNLEKENTSLTNRLRLCEKQMTETTTAQQETNDEIETMSLQINDHLNQAAELQEQIRAVLKGESNS